jgi:hypothetical protein
MCERPVKLLDIGSEFNEQVSGEVFLFDVLCGLTNSVLGSSNAPG